MKINFGLGTLQSMHIANMMSSAMFLSYFSFGKSLVAVLTLTSLIMHTNMPTEFYLSHKEAKAILSTKMLKLQE